MDGDLLFEVIVRHLNAAALEWSKMHESIVASTPTATPKKKSSGRKVTGVEALGMWALHKQGKSNAEIAELYHDRSEESVRGVIDQFKHKERSEEDGEFIPAFTRDNPNMLNRDAVRRKFDKCGLGHLMRNPRQVNDWAILNNIEVRRDSGRRPYFSAEDVDAYLFRIQYNK